MANIIHFYGPKAGVGTSTTAVIAATHLSKNNNKVLYWDKSRAHDVHRIMSVTDTDEMHGINPNLSFTQAENMDNIDLDAFDVVVVDNGTNGKKVMGLGSPVAYTRVAVISNSYLGLAAASKRRIEPDKYVMVHDTDGVLGERDVNAVLGTRVVIVQRHASIARAVDAGLLVSRASSFIDDFRSPDFSDVLDIVAVAW